MMMSLIFIVGLLSLLLLPLTCLSILFYQQQQKEENTSTVAENNKQIFSSYLAQSHLSSMWELLLHHAVSPNCPLPARIIDGESVAGARRYEGGGEAEECRVCLCRFDQGEEIRELRCSHLFHRPCLDAWLATGSSTCPLCRGGAEVLFFRFCSFSGSRRDHREDNWWLR